MKKVYLFYLFDESNKMNTKNYPAIDGLEIIKRNRLSYVLYGWTPNKDVRKRFKDMRDMSKFIEVVHEVSKEEVNKFSDDNSDVFLEERAITTKKISDDGKITKQIIQVLSTKKELDIMVYDEQLILRGQLEKMISNDVYIRECFFIKQYREILEFLHLDDILSYAYPLDETDHLPFSIFTNDTLAIYTHLYHNTYRKDIGNESL